ncbi:nuclear transport factor 2 family protein [Mycobacterium sp. CVI_P3]|uniref:Nuclear transport factor 2 family protein n=1 Tax=Mycobacterium pinniadriaticum TaxID=2994102 RepID=A0ABT3SP12_9MYCO|nr:nuclear transport factor 2 family protein [Mycobacterium pinniadriaticum]MCX2934461.1 nuclear transport factor 2 family protein [Mycobacterium pinniadriaticum]MCX2940884.1 nuclear transport factor 2 family protein [Mycobacterium pinniadriaticum]
MPGPHNVEIVRRFTEGLRAGDIDACAALLDHTNVFSEAPSLPFGGEYVGIDGFRRMLAAVSRDFRVRLEPPEIAGTDDWVAVVVHGTFTSRGTGRSMPVECVDIYRLRDAKIVRVDVHYKEPGALTELCREPVGSDLAPAAPGASPIDTSHTNRGELT